MPRRKRTTAQNEGQRKCRRADNKDEDTLVISDSENEEEEEAVSKVSTREARWQDRETRAQMQDMTEEEMLDLAMRLSKQEANSAAQRQQLEDDDIQKAIAESLHVSHSQAWKENSETGSSVAKRSQDPSTVTARMRRKLNFPSKREAHRARDDVSAAAESGEDSMQDSKSLLPMPDLSQKTLSQSPPTSPSLPSVPSTSSQEHQSSQWKIHTNKQVLKAPNEQNSPEYEPSQDDSETQCSAAFLQQCFVRVDKDLMSTGRTLDNFQTSQNLSLSLNCPNGSHPTQKQSPSPVKSPVFVKTDPKESTALSADNGTLYISKNIFTDKVCTLKKEEEEDDTCKNSSSHKNQVNESREHQKRLSLCRKAQSSARKLVPNEEVADDGAKQETVQPEQLKDGSNHRTNFNAELEKVPNSEDMPLHADRKSLEEFTSHMVLHLSDDDDDDDEDEGDEKIAVPSPVFHQECIPHAGHPKLSPTQHCFSPSTATSSPLCSRTQDSDLQNICAQKKCTSKTAYTAESNQREHGVQKKSACDSRSTRMMDEKSDGFVSYYWGVPFCPRGQNPDDYTKVILSQLEVYEKSLKEAQHQLLHKAEWGLPLLPCRAERPFSRRMKRHRAPQLLEEEEEKPEKEEEDQKKADDEEEDDGEERAESHAASGEAAENDQNETYVVVSSPDSPETQKEIVEKSPLPFRIQHEDSDVVSLSSCRKSSPHDPSEDTQIDLHDENNKAQDENYDVEGTMCPETQMSEDNTPELMVTSPVQPQLQEETEVMEVDEEAAEDERMEHEEQEQQQQREPLPPQNQRVECPMCSRFFPISKIEVHAAYCDGTTEEPEQEEEPSQVPALRSRNRRIEMGGTSPRSTENRSEQRHKCYLCQRFFTSEEMYIHHVDKCLKQKQSKSNQGNGLLSALNKAEHVDDDDSGAGPSDTTIKNHGGPAESSEVAESGGEDDGSASGFYVSSSPIKSFTPISEATDCLIDFQNQYSDRTSRRLGRKRKLKLFKMA